MTTQTIVAQAPPGKPPVLIDAGWYARFHDLASASMERDPDVAALLLDELQRAEVRPAGELPANVVTIGSEVMFRYNDDGHCQTIFLVLPGDADISKGRVSVFTPIGATLLGLEEGRSMAWTTRHGETRSLSVLSVKQLTSPMRT